MPALPTDEILRQEARAIHPQSPIPDDCGGTELKRELNKRASAALCLSGGGIRSAAFSLGIVQALAAWPPIAHMPRNAEEQKAAAKKSLLAEFHYLSTVSGGGYTGSLLSAWRKEKAFPDIWQSLVGRATGAEQEAHAIGWLRSYSNYLTPKLGIASSDTWAAVALSTRNLLLNWVVILPALCAVLVWFKIFAVISDWTTRNAEISSLQFGLALIGFALLTLALALVTRNRPTRRRDESRGLGQTGFLFGPLVLSVLSALTLMQFLASDLFGLFLLQCQEGNSVPLHLPIGIDLARCAAGRAVELDGLLQPRFSAFQHLYGGAIIGAIVYAAGWILGWPSKPSVLDFLLWAVSGAVYGALLGWGMYLYVQIPGAGIWIFSSEVLHLVFGIPWILFAQVIAEGAFVGLTNYQARSDADREWFGRASGLLLGIALGWFVLNFLVFFGVVLNPLDFITIDRMKTVIPIIGALSGIVTALVGKSSYLPAKGESKGLGRSAANVILAIAATLFAAALIIGASYMLDQLIIGETLVPKRFDAMAENLGLRWETLSLLALAFVICLMVAVIASWVININRFSLHALYRNRLIRAFLGAARDGRKQNPFTGFDSNDNPRMAELWSQPEADNWRPFHVVNIALNIVAAKNLAWQERKAEPFTVSPLHAGSACAGFRESRLYGDRQGISLGTAMAISGAAASPNMGYHSSPAITFLMTMCNVRLGWWLGNPGPKGESCCREDGPRFAIVPLVQEALGLTTDDSRFVYLSDGGHFENLGLYEMIRRRCRFILISDAGCDPDFAFEDLGNAVRKISIDLGVPIRFHKLEQLKRRPTDGTDVGAGHAYHAIADIDYQSADGGGENGIIVYVKAGYHGVESAGIRSYAVANAEFPHESTLNQWFSESQFESYRSLGFEIMQGALRRTQDDPACRDRPEIKNIFGALHHAAENARA